jgi:outer membrane protein
MALPALLLTASLHAQSPLRLSMEECISRAVAHHPRAAVAQTEVLVSRSVAAQADALRSRPLVEVTQMFGPSPAANGGPYDPALRSDIADLGLFTRTEATLIMPLYTFGKLQAAADAARHGLAAARYQREATAAEIRRDVRKAYYGVLLAREIRALADDTIRRLAKARARVRELIEEEELQPSDQHRLDVFTLEIEARRAAASATEAALLDALKSAMGIAPSAAFDIASQALERATGEPVDEAASARAALESRPEVQQLRAAVEARSALARAARADLFPQFYIGAQLRHGYAPNRTDQRNPFVRDDFNFLQGGAAIGFRYSLNFSAARARAGQALAERDRMAAQRRAAESAIALQSRNAARARQACALAAEVREKAARTARGWLATAEANFDLGVGDTRDLVDAFQAYIQTKASLLQALFDENAAEAELEYAEGRK